MAGFAPVRKLRAWARRHSYSFFSSLGNLLQHRIGTLMTVAVLGIAVLLPLGLFVTLKNLDRLDLHQQEWNAVTAYLAADAPQDQVRALAEEMQARADVAGVELVSPDEGLARFGEVSGFGESLALLESNPLPWVLSVLPAQAAGEIEAARVQQQADELMDMLRGHALVESVEFDYKWLQRLGRLLDLGRAAVVVLSLLFGAGVMLLVANTIRLDVAARAEEIEVFALMGAGNGFIRQPFLYSGFWYGAMGGALALALLAAIVWYLAGPLEALLDSYGLGFRLYSLGWERALAVVLGSGLLGWLGAWLAVQRYLRLLAVGGTLGRR